MCVIIWKLHRIMFPILSGWSLNTGFRQWDVSCHMITLSNGIIFRVTGHLCREFTGPRWIPRTKASDAERWCFLLICIWINGWVNNREAVDLRRNRAHCDVTVVMSPISILQPWPWQHACHDRCICFVDSEIRAMISNNLKCIFNASRWKY